MAPNERVQTSAQAETGGINAIGVKRRQFLIGASSLSSADPAMSEYVGAAEAAHYGYSTTLTVIVVQSPSMVRCRSSPTCNVNR